jgi:hypothetical protein
LPVVTPPPTLLGVLTVVNTVALPSTRLLLAKVSPAVEEVTSPPTRAELLSATEPLAQASPCTVQEFEREMVPWAYTLPAMVGALEQFQLPLV